MANKPNPNINMILSSYKGILSDSIPLQTPSLISNDSRLQDILISSIASKKPYKDEEGNWNLKENDDDIFVNKQYTIDFLENCKKILITFNVLLIRGANIEKVNVVDGEYRVTFGEKPLNDYEYNAVIVKAPSGCAKPKGLSWANEIPLNQHECDDRVFIP